MREHRARKPARPPDREHIHPGRLSQGAASGSRGREEKRRPNPANTRRRKGNGNRHSTPPAGRPSPPLDFISRIKGQARSGIGDGSDCAGDETGFVPHTGRNGPKPSHGPPRWARDSLPITRDMALPIRPGQPGQVGGQGRAKQEGRDKARLKDGAQAKPAGPDLRTAPAQDLTHTCAGVNPNRAGGDVGTP